MRSLVLSLAKWVIRLFRVWENDERSAGPRGRREDFASPIACRSYVPMLNLAIEACCHLPGTAFRQEMP